jgi:TolB-like protein
MTGGQTGWRLALTGGFDLAAADGRQIRVSGKKAKGLLAILAMSPGLSATRARLKSLLWSDRGEAQAGDSLRQLLAVLRKELAEQGCDILLVRDDQVGLHAETLRIDTDEIVKLPAQAAAGHYRGPLLNGLDVGDNQFEDWLAAERSTLQAQVIKVLEQLCAEGLGEARIAAAQRLVGLDTMREASHRALISAYLAMGEKALAKKQLESLAQILERELGVKPSTETLSLFATAEAPVQSNPPQSPRPVIALLIFANQSGDAAQKYFSDGISADIATELSRFREFAVKSERGGDSEADPAQLGRKLGVDFVVTGSVRRMGPRIRISVTLIDTQSGEQVWSERFDSDEQAIFDVQDSIVQSIAAQLASRLRMARLEAYRRKPPSSLAAYDYVLRGDALPIGNPAVEEEARQLFRKAIELDPGYARAHAALGEYEMLKWLRDFDAPRTLLVDALAISARSVLLDDKDPICHVTLSNVLAASGNFAKALHHGQRAVALNPNHPVSISQLGFLHGFLGEPETGVALFEQARLINPHFEPSWYWRDLGVVLFVARRYEDASAAFVRSPEMLDWVEAYLAACCTYLGRTEQAKAHAARTLQLTPGFTVARFMSREIYKRAEDTAHLTEGLRRAGIPD